MTKIRKPTLMQSLLWKDYQTLRPLGIAVAVGSIVFVGIVALSRAIMTRPGELDDLIVFYWFMMPCMLALGSPAMLVGQEEEKGTLQWVRTLPVRWQQIATSKLIISLVFLVAAWVLSFVLLFLSGTQGFHSGYFVNAMLSPEGFYRSLFYSVAILLTGFATAYAFRSVLVGLFVLPIVMIPISMLEMAIGVDLKTATFGTESLRFGVMICVLVVLYFLYRSCARWRLSRAKSGSSPVKSLTPKIAYRPPVAIGLSRPSRKNAMLWQQARQIAIPLAILTLLSLGVVLMMGRPRRIDPEVMFFAGALAVWIGGLVFYGDSYNGRRGFFADRGVRPWTVWWTRVLLPLLAMVLILIAAIIRGNELSTPMLFLTCFCLGQFVSQWVSRPVMAFFAGPVFVLIVMFTTSLLTGWVWGHGEEAFTISFVAIGPIFLFGTMRLCKHWIDGESGWGFNFRFIKYSMFAIIVPAFIAVSAVLLLTPAADPRFRKRAVSAVQKIPFSKSKGWIEPSSRIAINPHQFHAIRSHDDVRLELANEGSIGQYVAIGELQTLIRDPETDDKLKLDAIRVLLKFSQVTRQGALDGNIGLPKLLAIAEVSEELIVNTFEVYGVLDRQDAKTKSELVAQLPTTEVRRDSRRTALLMYWNEVQGQNLLLRGNVEEAAETLRTTPEALKRRPATYTPNAGMLRLQLRRSNRLLDAAFAMLLDQLDTGLPKSDSDERSRRDELMYACGWLDSVVLSGSWAQDLRSVLSRTWTSDFEDRIESLRKALSRSEIVAHPDVWL